MKQEIKHVECPKCGNKFSIDVNEILYHQLREEANKEYNQKLLSEKTKMEKKLREQLQTETSEQIRDMQKELQEKSLQVRELNKTKSEVEKLKREKEEMREQISFEKEKEFSEKMNDEKQKIRKQVDGENTMKIKELEKQLADQKELAQEMKRKADQGSTQLQGEVQELEIERLLREAFIHDEITEIKKGQRGADVIHSVRTQQNVLVGKILYESKRTRVYDAKWLTKLREDNLIVKADVMVLVTEAMPEREDKFFFKDDVWVCSFTEVKALSFILRHGLLQIHSLSLTHQGKETKMELLYQYLTSQEFKGQFGAIIDGFKSLQDNYQSEKLKMQKIWKEREKQLEKILTNSVNFYGSLKSIAGNSIGTIKALELSDGENN